MIIGRAREGLHKKSPQFAGFKKSRHLTTVRLASAKAGTTAITASEKGSKWRNYFSYVLRFAIGTNNITIIFISRFKYSKYLLASLAFIFIKWHLTNPPFSYTLWGMVSQLLDSFNFFLKFCFYALFLCLALQVRFLILFSKSFP